MAVLFLTNVDNAGQSQNSNKPTGEGAEGDTEVTYKDIIMSDVHYN